MVIEENDSMNARTFIEAMFWVIEMGRQEMWGTGQWIAGPCLWMGGYRLVSCSA